VPGLLALAVCVLVFCAGCGRTTEARGDIHALAVERFRVLKPDDDGTARVLAELTNKGSGPVKRAVVTAILRGEQGRDLGQASVEVTNVMPGQPQIIALVIEARTGKGDVEFHFSEPGDAAPPPAVAPPANEPARR
jgi:hypothetical protein